VKGESTAARPTQKEEAEAKKLGLRYFNIPVVYGEPKDESVLAKLCEEE
jgi:hypothetical protein